MTSTRLGAWVQDRFRIGSRLTLEGGLRLDWSGAIRRTTLSPRLGATYWLDDSTRLRAGGGLFTQSPGYEKLVQADYFVDLSSDGPLGLSHERAWHAVLGFVVAFRAKVEGRHVFHERSQVTHPVGRLNRATGMQPVHNTVLISDADVV